jgi:drug/metabolite transporter (DMT)-like permease
LLGIALFTGARWPSSWRAFKNIATVGALMQACGLGGVYFGMHLGVNAGVSSLIAGLSPLLTAIGAWWFLNDRIGSRQWLGVALGIVGVGIVVADKMALGSHWQGYAITFAGLSAFVAGTLYQKKYCDGMDLKTGSFIQTAAAAVVIAIPALVFEGFHVTWTPAFVGAIAWMAVINSAAAMTMMLLLLSRGSASSVAALFYLVPPITASMAYIAFHEAFGRFTLVGFAVVAASVYLGTRPSGIPSTRDFRLSSAPPGLEVRAACTDSGYADSTAPNRITRWPRRGPASGAIRRALFVSKTRR